MQLAWLNPKRGWQGGGTLTACVSAARFTHVKDKAKLYDLVNSITALLPSDRTWPRQEERYVAFLNAFPEFERIYL